MANRKMEKIKFQDKKTGDKLFASDIEQIKYSVNDLYDKLVENGTTKFYDPTQTPVAGDIQLRYDTSSDLIFVERFEEGAWVNKGSLGGSVGTDTFYFLDVNGRLGFYNPEDGNFKSLLKPSQDLKGVVLGNEQGRMVLLSDDTFWMCYPSSGPQWIPVQESLDATQTNTYFTLTTTSQIDSVAKNLKFKCQYVNQTTYCRIVIKDANTGSILADSCSTLDFEKGNTHKVVVGENIVPLRYSFPTAKQSSFKVEMFCSDDITLEGTGQFEPYCMVEVVPMQVDNIASQEWVGGQIYYHYKGSIDDCNLINDRGLFGVTKSTLNLPPGVLDDAVPYGYIRCSYWNGNLMIQELLPVSWDKVSGRIPPIAYRYKNVDDWSDWVTESDSGGISTYQSGKIYKQNDAVIKDFKIWVCHSEISKTTWDITDWTEQDPPNPPTYEEWSVEALTSSNMYTGQNYDAWDGTYGGLWSKGLKTPNEAITYAATSWDGRSMYVSEDSGSADTVISVENIPSTVKDSIHIHMHCRLPNSPKFKEIGIIKIYPNDDTSATFSSWFDDPTGNFTCLCRNDSAGQMVNATLAQGSEISKYKGFRVILSLKGEPSTDHAGQWEWSFYANGRRLGYATIAEQYYLPSEAEHGRIALCASRGLDGVGSQNQGCLGDCSLTFNGEFTGDNPVFQNTIKAMCARNSIEYEG